MGSRLLVLAVLSFLTVSCAPGQHAAAPAGSPSARVDELFQKMDSTVTPGCALAVVKDGRILYERGYGMADLDHNVPITPGYRISRGLDVEAVHGSFDRSTGPGGKAFAR